MSLKTDHYTYRIVWSEDDHEYVGLCAEFPSLSWLARTPEDALQGIRKVAAEAVADMQDIGETPPIPLSNRSYSGKLLVRIPPEVHRQLATKAAEQGISLNRLISSRLSAADQDLPERLKTGHIQAKEGRGRFVD
jgi:predicted HicB family RNase H-like nuclease